MTPSTAEPIRQAIADGPQIETASVCVLMPISADDIGLLFLMTITVAITCITNVIAMVWHRKSRFGCHADYCYGEVSVSIISVMVADCDRCHLSERLLETG